jgi:hypothetical protein
MATPNTGSTGRKGTGRRPAENNGADQTCAEDGNEHAYARETLKDKAKTEKPKADITAIRARAAELTGLDDLELTAILPDEAKKLHTTVKVLKLAVQEQRAADEAAERRAESGRMGTAAPANDVTRPEDLSVTEMLERFVHVATGPQIVDTGNVYRRFRPREFHEYFAHSYSIIGKHAMQHTVAWGRAKQRKAVHAMTFHPGRPQVFKDERGLAHLNIWQEPTWPAADPRLAAPFFDHLAYLIPDPVQREAFTDWWAHAVQQPAVRPHHHFLLLASREGTGRSWLEDLARRLWSERHATQTDLHRLLDADFNAELSGKIMVGVQEVHAPADERYQNKDRLKSLLTDTTIRINEKHLP